jgi:hypothetical protein
MRPNKKKQRYRQFNVSAPRFTPAEPSPITPQRGATEAELEELKKRLLQPLLSRAADATQATPLQHAANEAAGLAWFTPFPLLFFPALLEEKVYAAERQEARQRCILARTGNLLEKATE